MKNRANSFRQFAPTGLILASVTGGAMTVHLAMAWTRSVSTPPLTASERRVTLGNIDEGSVAQRQILLTNTGTTPLHISRVITSCGCTSTAAPTVVLPKHSEPLTISFDSLGKAGPVHESVQVVVAGYDRKELQIPISGFVNALSTKASRTGKRDVPASVGETAACTSDSK